MRIAGAAPAAYRSAWHCARVHHARAHIFKGGFRRKRGGVHDCGELVVDARQIIRLISGERCSNHCHMAIDKVLPAEAKSEIQDVDASADNHGFVAFR